MKKILVTYFGPFKNFVTNPSQLVARELETKFQNNSIIDFKYLDVSFQAIDSFIIQELNDYSHIFHLGVASKSSKMRLELVANNLIDGIDINNQIKKEIIDCNSQEKIATNFLKSQLDYFKNIYPESILTSENTGNYLCNYLYYKSLSKFKEKKILFIHIANFIDIVDSVSKDTQVEIIDFIIKSQL
jgi:pyroglutamyl-peptidase